MIDFKYNVEWLDDFLKKLWQLTFEKNLNKSIKKAIYLVERQAKINSPVDTWLLRNSYSTDFMWLKWEVWNYRIYAQRREYENYKNPSKRLYFTRAVESTDVGKIFENDLIDLLQFLSDE